jgi:hypothetical protein
MEYQIEENEIKFNSEKYLHEILSDIKIKGFDVFFNNNHS